MTDGARCCCLPVCRRKKKKKRQRQRQQSKCLVTTVPDFDGYQWRKYGQKQIEGAMYPRYPSPSSYILYLYPVNNNNKTLVFPLSL